MKTVRKLLLILKIAFLSIFGTSRGLAKVEEEIAFITGREPKTDSLSHKEFMIKASENLVEAQKQAMSLRPKVGGFPYLAETLRTAGITRNVWSLPSCQSLYRTKYGCVVQQGTPLISGTAEIPKFDREALIRALRADQAGNSTFPEFLKRSWEAGVVSYDVDFENRKVTYYGALGESYVENYPAVDIVSNH